VPLIAPDETSRYRLLVENPARLYGWQWRWRPATELHRRPL